MQVGVGSNLRTVEIYDHTAMEIQPDGTRKDLTQRAGGSNLSVIMMRECLRSMRGQEASVGKKQAETGSELEKLEKQLGDYVVAEANEDAQQLEELRDIAFKYLLLKEGKRKPNGKFCGYSIFDWITTRAGLAEEPVAATGVAPSSSSFAASNPGGLSTAGVGADLLSRIRAQKQAAEAELQTRRAEEKPHAPPKKRQKKNEVDDFRSRLDANLHNHDSVSENVQIGGSSSSSTAIGQSFQANIRQAKDGREHVAAPLEDPSDNLNDLQADRDEGRDLLPTEANPSWMQIDDDDASFGSPASDFFIND